MTTHSVPAQAPNPALLAPVNTEGEPEVVSDGQLTPVDATVDDTFAGQHTGDASSETPVGSAAPEQPATIGIAEADQEELRALYLQEYPDVQLSPDTVLIDGRSMPRPELVDHMLAFDASPAQRELIVGFLAAYVHGVPASGLGGIVPQYTIHDVQALMEEAIGDGSEGSYEQSYLAFLGVRRE
ncbi:MAG: hypothetical protein AAFQ82_19325, partial [Myxococcota bacterium]